MKDPPAWKARPTRRHGTAPPRHHTETPIPQHNSAAERLRIKFDAKSRLAALSSLKNSPVSRAFYDRKRAEGKSHKQALIALARRRINVIWAMLRDHTHYREPNTANPALAA
jgi:hypothetical protein